MRALLAEAEAHARAAGLARIEIHWLNGDARACAVWQKLGFAPYLQRGFLVIPPV